MKNLIVILTLAVGISTFANIGVDSGGGNLLPNIEKVTKEQIRSTIYHSKPLIYAWLSQREVNYRTKLLMGQDPWDDPISEEEEVLFESTPDIFAVLEKLKIEIRELNPCFDNSGKAVDASIWTETENTICISSFRLSQRLRLQTYEAEVLALIIHEASHLVGLEELSARIIQTQAQNDLLRVSLVEFFQDLEQIIEHNFDTVFEIEAYLGSDEVDWLQVLNSYIMEIQGLDVFFLLNKKYGFLRANFRAKFINLVSARSLLLFHYFVIQSEEVAKFFEGDSMGDIYKYQEETRVLYDQYFQGKQHVIYTDLYNRGDDNRFNRTIFQELYRDFDYSEFKFNILARLDQTKIYKISNVEGARKEILYLLELKLEAKEELQKLKDSRFEIK